MGPLAVEELCIALVGLSFPLDLSGGVPRFRHRRGVLERLVVTARHERLAKELAPRLRGVLGPTSPAVTIAPTSGGLLVGLGDGAAALAFEALWAPREGDARWVVASARAIGLAKPALAAAIAAVDALVGKLGERSGAIVTIARAASAIAREVLPAAGARAPDVRGARFGDLETDAAGWRVACDRAFSPAKLDGHVVRELELAALTREADDALAAGELERAREGYVALLERAPRHVEIARRIADLDRCIGGRAEAALATLVEAMPAIDGGVLGAELLEATGDREAARAALARAAEREPYGPLAAFALARAGALADDAAERMRRLDEAVARAPSLAAPRWARFERRLDLSDFDGAMADAEHLEAATRGAFGRHEVWQRAGEAFLARGHDAKAAALFERSLRYVPESARGLAGLARSLLAAGRTTRGLDLLARAVELGEAAAKPSWELVLALANALAEHAHDLPAAVARVRSIPAGVAESLDARGLEGRHRAALGDLAGASIAFARMRDWIEVATELDAARAARWLAEAARFERDVQRDPLAAQRHLGVALRLAPKDRAIAKAFREAAAEAARRPPAAPATEAPHDEEHPTNRPASPDEASASDEARAETLSDRLRGDPANHALAIELADVLARLGRDLDLFALLSARLEEAHGPERLDLVPRQRAVLARLAAAAREAGNADEATLYESALRKLG